MRTCAEITAALQRYVDSELTALDALDVEAHLLDCAPCRERYESMMHVVGSLRAAHPLYTAPMDSYQRVKRQIERQRQRRFWGRMTLAASLLLLALAAWVTWSTRMEARAPFSTFAAETHRRYSAGAIPLDIRSQDPKVVEAWLGQRLPFHVVLPEYPVVAGMPVYSLTGARLERYHDEDAAYLAYRVEGRPVSLLITSSTHNVPGGGATQQIGRLTFHSTSHQGLDAVAWVDRGLSYSLVSERGQAVSQSCVVCHGGLGGRAKFQGLRAGS